MTAVSQAAAKAARTDRFFYLGMAILVALVIVGGFGPTYTSSLAPPGLPLWVHLHGAVMTLWIGLFGVQAWLAGSRNLRLHRRLGWLSTGLVALMVPLGVATNLLAVHRGATPPFFKPAEMIAFDLTDLALFTGLFVAAVLLRRRGDWHKRLLLTATVLLAMPALGRLIPLRGLGLSMIVPAATALLIVIALIGPANDLVRRGRVHPAYLWAVGLLVAVQPLHTLLAATPPLQALAAWLQA